MISVCLCVGTTSAKSYKDVDTKCGTRRYYNPLTTQSSELPASALNHKCFKLSSVRWAYAKSLCFCISSWSGKSFVSTWHSCCSTLSSVSFSCALRCAVSMSVAVASFAGMSLSAFECLRPVPGTAVSLITLLPARGFTVTPQAIYSRTGVRQLSYVRRSYDIDTAPFAIHEKWRTYNLRIFGRKSATYLPMSYDRHRRPFYWLLPTLICIKYLLICVIHQKLHIHVCVKVYVTYLGK